MFGDRRHPLGWGRVLEVEAMTEDVATCADCDAQHDLLIYAADYGQGAFLAVLCSVCAHRRRYRGHLIRELLARRGSSKRKPTTEKNPPSEEDPQ